MSIPKNVARTGKQVSSGKRLNNRPAYIVIALVGATLFGIYYAASHRATVPTVSADVQGEQMLEVQAAPSSQIEFIQDQPDGLAGMDENLFETDEQEVQQRQSDLDAQITRAYEQQRLTQMERDNALRQKMITRQIEQAQAAIEGDMTVDGFGAPSEFARNRADKRIDNITEIRASASQVPLIGQQPRMDPAQINGLSSDQLQRIVDQLPSQYRAALQSLSAQATPVQPGNPSTTNTTGVQAANRYVQSNQRHFTLNNTVQPPRSRFEIKTGTVLPAAMISAANSDLPGDIVGQITQNIYDTQAGRYVLIPQGTKLFGRYDAFTQLGQQRLLIVWDRLIFPDAETLDIGGMQGYDGLGQSGVYDKVNTHFVRTLFNAFLISVVSASGEALTDAATEVDDSFILNLSTSFGDAASQPFDAYLRNRLKIRPTLQIRSGFRFNVMVSKDIAFDAPYRYGYTQQQSRP